MSQEATSDDPYVEITVTLRQSTLEWLDAALEEFGLRSRAAMVSLLLDELVKPSTDA